jgi:hypothetical protein
VTRVRALVTGLSVVGVVVVVAGSCLGKPAPRQEASSLPPGSTAAVPSAGRPDPGPEQSGTASPQVLSPPAGSVTPRPGELLKAYVTAYTWYDNDPQGAAIADPVLHSRAGGTGTYADPVTLAVAAGAYSAGTRFYLPHVRRYFMVEDTCAACGQRSIWVDMWIDGRSGSFSDVQDCANRLTGDHVIELDPPAGRPVDPSPLFSRSGCYSSS